jgi:hypothetical protein
VVAAGACALALGSGAVAAAGRTQQDETAAQRANDKTATLCGDNTTVIAPVFPKLSVHGRKARLIEGLAYGSPQCKKLGNKTVQVVVKREGNDGRLHVDSALTSVPNGNYNGRIGPLTIPLKVRDTCLPGAGKRFYKVVNTQTYTPDPSLAPSAQPRSRSATSNRMYGRC